MLSIKNTSSTEKKRDTGGEVARPVSPFWMLGIDVLKQELTGAFAPLRGFRGEVKGSKSAVEVEQYQIVSAFVCHLQLTSSFCQ